MHGRLLFLKKTHFRTMPTASAEGRRRSPRCDAAAEAPSVFFSAPPGPLGLRRRHAPKKKCSKKNVQLRERAPTRRWLRARRPGPGGKRKENQKKRERERAAIERGLRVVVRCGEHGPGKKKHLSAVFCFASAAPTSSAAASCTYGPCPAVFLATFSGHADGERRRRGVDLEGRS